MSVLLAMAVSALIGLVLGFKLHTIAGVEGFFSGMMAGMMGAMTVEMLTVEEGAFLLFVSVLVLIATAMLSVRYILQHTFQTLYQKYDYLLLFVTCLLFLLAFWTFPQMEVEPPAHPPQDRHDHE